jgi:uncharacterized damage-inducible protein DinB
MHEIPGLTLAVVEGWRAYQTALVQALAPLNRDQLDLQASPETRRVGVIAAHVVGARARWFKALMGEGGEAFESFGRWDGADAPSRTAAELVGALETTWAGMHAAIARWTPEEWAQTWPGEDTDEPAVITRQWVIWHLIEHDVHHGGQISLTLRVHGAAPMQL